MSNISSVSPLNSSPSYRTFVTDYTAPTEEDLEKILATGSSIEFLADGLVGMCPEVDDETYMMDPYKYSEPPHELSAHAKTKTDTKLQQTVTTVHVSGYEKGDVCVCVVQAGDDLGSVALELSSYLRMMGRRWDYISNHFV
jgi:hypothetical protein